jgi:ABC-type Na+ efflux pump permease subunit
VILPIGLLVDRIILFAIVIIIAPLFDITHPLFSLALVAVGVPGILLQLLVVPAAVKMIEKKYPHWKPDRRQ